MDEAKIREIVAGAVADAFTVQQTEPVVCRLGLEKEQHDEDHRVIQSFVKVLDRVDNIKWGVLKSLAVTACVFLGGAVIVGIFVIAKSKIDQLP